MAKVCILRSMRRTSSRRRGPTAASPRVGAAPKVKTQTSEVKRLAVPCPTCGAVMEEPCKRADGQAYLLKAVHRARQRMAVRALLHQQGIGK